MEKEEGLFKLYKRIAKDLNLNERDLAEHVSYGGEKRFMEKDEWGNDMPRWEINGVKIYQSHAPWFIRHSKKHEKSGLSLIVGEVLDIDKDKLFELGLLRNIGEICENYYFFSLVGNGLVRIAVKDDKIICSDVHKESCPRELFEKGRNYKDALMWMVREYAGMNRAER